MSGRLDWTDGVSLVQVASRVKPFASLRTDERPRHSRPFAQRLTEPMLKELEKKLRDANATLTEDTLWRAFAATAPEKVKGRSQAGRFADLVALLRFSLEQRPVLEPFADSSASVSISGSPNATMLRPENSLYRTNCRMKKDSRSGI